MAKKCYIGNTSISRNIKSMYIGVDGVARKVIKGYIGVNGVARQFWLDYTEAGHYWIIDYPNNIITLREYSADGELVLTQTNVNEFPCPAAGDYQVELHSYGGTGGTGAFGEDSVSIPYSASGGDGGGSGAKIITTLSKGNYSFSFESGKTTFDSYYVNRGGNGTAGSVNTRWGSASGGTGGSVGACHSSMTNIASRGSDGGGWSNRDYTPGDGSTYGGSGGHTQLTGITTPYGTGGLHGGVSGGSVYSPGSGYGPAIIIIKQ